MILLELLVCLLDLRLAGTLVLFDLRSACTLVLFCLIYV